MPAHMTYEIHGTNSAHKHVKIEVRVTATLTQEVAEFMLREKYPSAANVYWTHPATRNYKPDAPGVVTVAKLATTPVRRAG